MKHGSITWLFGPLREGDDEAARLLWQRFASRLIGLARKRLRAAPRRAADEEDAVLNAFDSFCRAAERGQFPQMHDRHDLWHLLTAITVRKVSDQIQHERRLKRGGGTVRCEGDLDRNDGRLIDLENIVAREPTPQQATEMAEQFHRLLDLLPEDDLRDIALWKMEGYTNQEIADRFDCARSTIQRKLKLIEARWEREVL